jgi:hypothetical protein
MDYLKLLSEAEEPRYFLSLLSCGTTFSGDRYGVTGNGYNNTIQESIKTFKKYKSDCELSFEDFAKAIDTGLSNSTHIEYLYPEVLGHTGLSLCLIDQKKGEEFCHYLLKKYKNIDFIEEPTVAIVNQAITSCIIDDYVMSFQKKINHYEVLDKHLTSIFDEIYKHRDIIGMSDMGVFQKNRNGRRYHEYILTSVDDKPINPAMFGQIIDKCVDSIINREKLEDSIKEVMLFCKLQFEIEDNKQPGRHLKI